MEHVARQTGNAEPALRPTEVRPIKAPSNHRPRWADVALVLPCIALVCAQVFVRPLIGLANNADFMRVAGWLSLNCYDNNRVYFVYRFDRGLRWHWHPKPLSSEVGLAWIADTLSRWTSHKPYLDIRYLGGVHAFLLFAGFLLLAIVLRQLIPNLALRAASMLLFTWIFTDVMYVSYFNTMYSDAAAVVSLLLLFASALWAVIDDEASWTTLAIIAVAAFLYVTSKTQHGVWFLLPSIFIAYIGTRAKRRSKLVFCAAVSASLAFAVILQVRDTPPLYKADPLFTVIFQKIVPNMPDPAHDLLRLGLDGRYLQYKGMSTYDSRSPMMVHRVQEPAIFVARTSYWRVFCFYLQHPGRTLLILKPDLTQSAPGLRPLWLANYRREDGFPPSSVTHHFDSWSSLRSKVYRLWPEHIVVWYALFLVGCGWVIAKGAPPQRRLALLAAGAAIMGILEFCFASLADAGETDRHLLVFHEFTDLTIWMAATSAAVYLAGRTHQRGTGNTRPVGPRVSTGHEGNVI